MPPRYRPRPAPTSSDEDAHLTSPVSPTTAARPYFPRRMSADDGPAPGDRSDDNADVSLPPPRPFFLAQATQRSSWSSVDTAPSDSDRETPPPSRLPPGAAPPRAGTLPASGVPRNGPYVQAAAYQFSSFHSASDSTTSAALAAGAPHTAEPASPSSPVSGRGSRAPPSSFVFPHGTPVPVHPYSGPINPDPLPPATSRRSSLDSLRASSSGHAPAAATSAAAGMMAMRPAAAHNAFMSNSAIARASASATDLGLPLAPYASRVNGTASPTHSRRNSQDMSGFPNQNTGGALPRASSTIREPFLSPASRASSSFWQPPTPSWYGFPGGAGSTSSGNGSGLMLAGKKEPLPSSALGRKLSVSEKPWIKKADKWERWSWWTTFLLIWVGIIGAAVVCFFGFRGVQKLPNTCLVMEDDFNTFDTNTWSQDVELGGFGNGEFQMTTNSQNNTFIKNGQLYLMPTLTSDVIGTDAIFNGAQYTLSGCTSTNKTACSVTSSSNSSTVINPVMSSRISTVNSSSIQFGKVEVMAKLPTGDWLWPAIWMLPVNNTYGAWPLSGEIDIMEARGNGPSYAAQGSNFVRSSLNWGPIAALTAQAFGWQTNKRTPYSAGFHLYTFEWDTQFMRFSVDSKLHAMLDISTKKEDFFKRGNFPATVQNGSTQAVVQNIWENSPNEHVAPFDQEFYLIINLAVGGTSGWFPDNVGGKPWFDGSGTAMSDFAKAQDTWFATWPLNEDDRAFRIDSVKMYKLC